jgi:hypothetical protein
LPDADIFDDTEWHDIEPRKAAGVRKEDAEISLTFWSRAKGEPRARAMIVLRNEPYRILKDKASRFRVQIGGAGKNMIRIIPDDVRGRFELPELKGVGRMSLGHVADWPNEERRHVDATWTPSHGGLVLVLPFDFAEPTTAIRRPPPPVVQPTRPAAPSGIPITTKAPGLERQRAVVQMAGEPPPGRSALDQRRGGK